MHIKKRYTTLEMVLWTRYETLLFFIIIAVWVAAYYFFELEWLRVPWTPLALIGTAVAFVIGFQNNAAYGRIWEARKIWGGIVNTSRTFGMFVQDMITNAHSKTKAPEKELEESIRVLTYRHIAWMTALRHSMRQTKPWETILKQRTNKEWGVVPPEMETNVKDDLAPYISAEDMAYVMAKNNKQTALLYLQSHHLRALKEKGQI